MTRQMTETEMQTLWDEAHEAGMEAVENLAVCPMTVVDKNTGKSWFVEDGVCGFAWVNVKPGNSRFANWLKKNDLARKDEYYGGVTIWVSEFNQSMQKKEAYARAMSKVFDDAGLRSYAASRLD